MLASMLATVTVIILSFGSKTMETPKCIIKVYWNATCPCTVNAQFQELQAGLFTWAMAHHPHSAGCAMMPVFSYQRGMVHREESQMTTKLLKGSHNIDTQFFIPFDRKTDDRDERPLVYPGHIIYAVTVFRNLLVTSMLVA